MKKVLSLILSLVILSCGFFTLADSPYFDNNNNDEDKLVDVEVNSNVYTVKNGIVSGISVNTASGFAGTNFDFPLGIVMERNGVELQPDETIKTGTVIKQYYDDELCDTAVAAVSGDVNGDGNINVVDMVGIATHIVEKELEGAYGIATDTDCNGITNVTDILKARQIILNGIDSIDGNSSAYQQNTYNLLEKKGYYKLLGRYEDSVKGVTFDWTGSSIEFNLFCEGDVTLDISHRIFSYPVYIVPIVDGQRSYEQEDLIKITGQGDSTITVAKDLPRGYHNIKLVRNTEVMSSFVDLNSISLKGTLLKAPKDGEIMIEVIGDSISCGLAGRNWPYLQGQMAYGQAAESFAYLTAQNLNADLRTVASSGKSTLVYDDKESLPALVYDYQNKWKSAKDGETVYKPYNHSNQRDADVIFLALGQNDKRTNDNIEPLKQGLKDFANHLRDIHGEDTKIVFVYGMMNNNDEFNDAVFPVVASDLGGKESGFYSIKMEWCGNLNLGVLENGKRFDSHPTVDEHAYYAEKLTKFMQDEVLK